VLQIFEDILPKRETRWLNKTLRKLRRAANDARDLDVLGERLTAIANQKEGSELGKIVEQVAARRRLAQKPLVRSYEVAKRKRFVKRARAVKQRIRWRHDRAEPNFGDAARARLALPVEEFFTAATADLSDPTALHQMRIAGKRLRYAMELLAGAFDDTFRGELYPVFAEVQEELGIINDHATAILLFSQWMARAEKKGQAKLATELGELIANEEQQLGATSQAFLASWTADRSANLKARFDKILGGSAPA
jgi:CHAD domain-containing protein